MLNSSNETIPERIDVVAELERRGALSGRARLYVLRHRVGTNDYNLEGAGGEIVRTLGAEEFVELSRKHKVLLIEIVNPAAEDHGRRDASEGL